MAEQVYKTEDEVTSYRNSIPPDRLQVVIEFFYPPTPFILEEGGYNTVGVDYGLKDGAEDDVLQSTTSIQEGLH